MQPRPYINLLCPGPSLGRVLRTASAGSRSTTAGLLTAGPTVGVNRAAVGFACDWWVFADDTLHAACAHQVLGNPRVFTSAETFRRRREALHEPDVMTFEQLHESYDAAWSWGTFSACAALILCAHLLAGPGEIRVYGADWSSAPDWDGVQLAENRRDGNRWNHERSIWDRICFGLQGRDVVVSRQMAAVGGQKEASA